MYELKTDQIYSNVNVEKMMDDFFRNTESELHIANPKELVVEEDTFLKYERDGLRQIVLSVIDENTEGRMTDVKLSPHELRGKIHEALIQFKEKMQDKKNEMDPLYRKIMGECCDSLLERFDHRYKIPVIDRDKAYAESIAERVFSHTVARKGLDRCFVTEHSEKSLIKHIVWKVIEQGDGKETNAAYLEKCTDDLITKAIFGKAEEVKQLFTHDGQFDEEDYKEFVMCGKYEEPEEKMREDLPWIASSVRNRFSQCITED